MRMRRIVLAGGLVSATLVAVFGNRSSPSEVVSATRSSLAPMHTRLAAEAQSIASDVAAQTGTSPSRVLLLQDRVALTTHGIQTANSAPFAVLSWAPPPSPPPTTEKPSAPPLPFTYLGKELDGGQWRVFLARQNEILIVQANDIIGDTYRVESIAPPTVTILYLPLNETQQLSIE